MFRKKRRLRFKECPRCAKNSNARVLPHKIQPAEESSKTIRGRLCFTAFCIKYEIAARVKYYRAHTPLRIIYYSRYQRINIHAGAYGSPVRCVFDRQPCGFSLESRGIPLSGGFHSRHGSITVRGIPISQPNEVSVLFLLFFLLLRFSPGCIVCDVM